MDGQNWRLDLAKGRTPVAECQWWADRLGSREAEWGSAGAPSLFYSPEAEVQWKEVYAMGRGENAEKLSLEEDSRISIEGGLSRAGISPRATMLQGVDQPCGIRGLCGCGPALLFPSTAAPLAPTSPPQPLWNRVSTTLCWQQAAGTGAGVGAQLEAGREGESRWWQAR